MTNKTSSLSRKKPVAVQHSAADKAKMATLPSLNAAAVIEAYQGNVVGKDIDMNELILTLQASFNASKEGDLGGLERMLIGQATALQTIFTSLARRAQQQEYQKNYDSFLTLALKAQAQSRATIQAVIELKYPKQVAFVKQANISHGPQQVNNGNPSQGLIMNESTSHAPKSRNRKNKLLEGHTNGGTNLDIGTTTTASGRNPALEAVGEVHRANKH